MKQKILIVDDCDLVLEIYKDALESAGYEVITRNTPFGTASLIANEKPNLVLLDIFMPGLSGDRLVGVVKRDKSIQDTKVLLFSDRPADELQSISSSCGADGFIQKTRNHKELIQELKSWFRS